VGAGVGVQSFGGCPQKKNTGGPPLPDGDGSGVGVARISPQIGPPKPLLPRKGPISNQTLSGPSMVIWFDAPLGPSCPFTYRSAHRFAAAIISGGRRLS
jgi:hypothetical protein